MPLFIRHAAILPPPSLRPRRALGIAMAFIACYVLLDWATYVYPIRPFAITPWNPPAGMGLALLLLGGLRFWPALALAAFLADVLVRGIPPLPLFEPLAPCVITAGYAGMAALLRGPLGLRLEFDRLRDVSILLITSLFGTLLIAAAYVSVFRIGDLLPAYEFQPAVIRFWIGDLIGVVTTTPLLLVLANWPNVYRELRRRPWPWTEMVAQLGVVMLALWIIFSLRWVDEYKLFYLLFLPLIWIAMRHAIAGATLAIIAIQLGLIVADEVVGYRIAAVLEFQFLMLTLAVTGLYLGMVVTERRVARDALNRSESRLRAIVSTAPDGIVTVDEKGAIVASNPAALRIFGCAAGGLVGMRVSDVLPEFERVAHLGEPGEVNGVRTDGSHFPAELSVGTTGGGARELRIAIARDISHRKEIERELSDKQAELNRSARLAAAGEMAAALAHELHQPLSAIRNYARAARMLPGSANADELLDKVERQAARAAEVVQRLRDFFRGGASHLALIDVGQLVEGALEPMHEEAVQQHVTLETAVACNGAELLVDRVQIETVLHGLVGNALEAIATTSSGERRVRVAATIADDRWVRLSIIDSGPGVSPSIANRLFEPFATTKPTGIGLGLAISRSIVEAHGGKLWAEPGMSGGMVFHFTLPPADAGDGVDYDR